MRNLRAFEREVYPWDDNYDQPMIKKEFIKTRDAERLVIPSHVPERPGYDQNILYAT